MGGGIALAELTTHLSAEPKEQAPAQEGTPVWKSKISRAVVAGFTASALNVSRKAESGQLKGSDVRNLSIATAILFSHLDEIGLVAEMEKYIKDSGAFQTPFSSERMNESRRKAEAAGAYISDPAFNRLVGSQDEVLERLRPLIGQGLRVVHSAIIAELQQEADRLDRQRGTVTSAASTFAPILPVQSGFCVTLGIAGVYVATWSLQAWILAWEVPCLAGALTIGGFALSVIGVVAC